MKIVLIGSNGVIGKAISKALENHDVITVGHRSGELTVDLEDNASIEALFEKTGKVDAIICAAGNGSMGSFKDMSDADFAVVLNNKVMGQVNVAKIGSRYLNDNGSITLTSGQAANTVIPGALAIGMGCAAVESFVTYACHELEQGLRINVVSPGFVKESMALFGMDTANGVPAHSVADTYKQAITGAMSGSVLNATL